MNEQDTGAREAKSDDIVDDRGTDQAGGRELLKALRDRGFDASDEKLATALGRPAEEITPWMDGTGDVDDDVIIKARGIARERGIEIE